MQHRVPYLTLALFAGGLCAQQPIDTLILHEHEVIAPRLANFTSGTTVLAVDSSTLAQYRNGNLGDLLSNESPVFVKSYGLGSLATTAFRGGSANHTAILWNGFNIGSPMNGQIDLSLIPLRAVDGVEIQFGGTSALWGSGAVGGTIHLSNEPKFNDGLSIEAGNAFGSFGDRRQHLRVALGHDRWAGSVSLFNAHANNDFSFRNSEEINATEQRQTNAAFQQTGMIAESYFRINARQRIALRYWFQSTDRRIPPSFGEASSSARQEDIGHRITADWRRVGDRLNAFVRTAYFDENLHWFASETNTMVPSHSRTAIAEGEVKFRIAKGHSFDVGVNNTFAWASSEGYTAGSDQNRTALFAAYRFDPSARWRTTLSVRQEQVRGELVPFTWSIGSELELRKGLSVKAQMGRVYRIPTFNDLYWNPGGDPSLLPENGYSGEAGLAVKTANKEAHVHLSGAVTGFTRSIDNWIIWLPGHAYWQPHNVMQVWSRGVESRGTIAMRSSDVTIQLSVMTNYVLSTNEVAKSTNDASVGKQLIYVPIYSGSTKLALLHKDFTATFGATYTGYRYTSADNVEFLDPFVLANVSATYAIVHRTTFAVHLSAQAFNLLDETYRVVQGRPMPGRNFQVGINVAFHRPKQKTAIDN